MGLESRADHWDWLGLGTPVPARYLGLGTQSCVTVWDLMENWCVTRSSAGVTHQELLQDAAEASSDSDSDEADQD